MKLSCFSAVYPVMGWNQWLKWVAPRSVAQRFMAWAISLATAGSRLVWLRMQSFQAWKDWAER